MLSKIVLALGIVLAISALGNALKCYNCTYTTVDPKEKQTCDNSIECPAGNNQCTTSVIKLGIGADVISRGCGEPTICQNIKTFCAVSLKLIPFAKSCAAECCNGDNCNNYTPSSSTNVMVTKFTLSFMVIVGLILA